MKTTAIYENGKLVLSQPLPLPESSRVLVTIETEGAPDKDMERAVWLKLSEQSLMKTRGNSDDDVFNELLTK